MAWREGVVATLYGYELRMLLRDTRTILIAVFAPLLLFPLLIGISRWVERRQSAAIAEATYRYAVTGSEEDFAYYRVESALLIETFDPDTTRTKASFLMDRSPDPDALLRAGELQLVVEGMTADEFRRVRARELADLPVSDSAELAELAELPDVPVLRIHYRRDQDLSLAAFDRLLERLDQVQRRHRDSVYQAYGLAVSPEDVGEVDVENVASAERESGAFLGRILTPLLLFLMLSGGSIVAVDAISGEKERGTLETLLTTAARRSQIVNAKQLAVVTVGVVVTLVNLLNLLVYVDLDLIELPQSLEELSLGPLSLFVLLALYLPLTVLVSSALLLLSGWSKSHKEYQLYFFPLFLTFMVPTVAASLPGMDLRSLIALVPIAGVAVAVREVLIGEFDWPFLAIAYTSTGLAAWGALALTERALSTERLISAAELDEADLQGGPALFPRRVLRWFGIMWVALVVGSSWVGASLGLREQVLLNVVGIFFVGSLFLVRGYRLDPRAAFALRAPPPAAWPAVLIGAPAALVTGIGLAGAFQRLVPVPEEVLRSFGQFVGGGDLPLWQVVLFLAVVPGVFEELAFRGVLLHGLARRLRPVALALAVGTIFGVFHVSLWRIPPTAWLGVLLTAVVLLTGSIYPAMLWHALNNALAIVPIELGWVGEDYDLPLWSYPLGVFGLVIAFTILWMARRPYPTVRRDE